MGILDRNKTCPICGKFYHRWDIHRNAIPDKLHQRTEESLCQCEKGNDARAFRRMRRLEIDAENERKQKLREEALSIPERNQAYWAEFEKRKRR